MNVDLNPISNLPSKSYNYLNKLGANPIVLGILAIVIIFYYFIFNNLSGSSESISNTSGSFNFIQILLWGVFIALVLLNAVAYFYNYQLNASLSDLFTKKPSLDMEITTTKTKKKSSKDKKNEKNGKNGKNGKDKDDKDKNKNSDFFGNETQVYHVAGNNYTYNDAQAICKALKGKLANYQQIEDAYKSGGEWCNYGWSSDQLALYPTQLASYKKLRKIKGHEHDCGRPGINGGYIDNPNVRFGVNCYGVKPKITPLESKEMKINAKYPKSRKESKMQEEVKYWRQHLDQLEISPFNKSKWDE